MVEALPNWTRHIAAIRERLGRVPSVRPLGRGFRFLPASVNEYRVVQAYLTEASSADSGIKWYCYALAEEIPSRVAIKGLPPDTDAALVVEALKEKGFPARYARCILAKRGRPSCVFFVTLDHLSKEDLARVYTVNEILSMPGVSIEGWRTARGPAQCHRCQAFGHASTNCHRAIRCVRCAGEHIVADCPGPKEGPYKWANCGKNHAAVDKRCAIFRRKARAMGVAVPPSVPPTGKPGTHTSDPQYNHNPNQHKKQTQSQIAKGKGKGKGKSSLTLRLPSSVPQHMSTVEAQPSASNLMAEAIMPKKAGPTVKSRPKSGDPATLIGKPTELGPQTNLETAKKKKKKKKKKKGKEKDQTEPTNAEAAHPKILPKNKEVQEEMEVAEDEEEDEEVTKDKDPNNPKEPTCTRHTQRGQPSVSQSPKTTSFTNWLRKLWEKVSGAISEVVREIASGASPFGALLSGFYRLITQLNG